MYKGYMSGVITADTNIPIQTSISTNNNVIYNENTQTLQFLKPGWYDIYVTATMTGVAAGNVAFEEYVDGIPSIGAVNQHTITATTDIVSINISDVIHVTSAMMGKVATVGFRSDRNGTILTGQVVVEGRR